MAGGIGGTEPDSTSGSITPSNLPGIGFTPDPEAFAPYVVREVAISRIASP